MGVSNSQLGVCSCCNNSRYKCRAGCLSHDHLHWNLLPEEVRVAVIMHHFSVVQVTFQKYSEDTR